jgi:hypothetical protein
VTKSNDSRLWIDWKTALTYFCLLNSSFPNESELANLRVKLTDAGENQGISK